MPGDHALGASLHYDVQDLLTLLDVKGNRFDNKRRKARRGLAQTKGYQISEGQCFPSRSQTTVVHGCWDKPIFERLLAICRSHH